MPLSFQKKFARQRDEWQKERDKWRKKIYLG
jgi:hypothetical protein